MLNFTRQINTFKVFTFRALKHNEALDYCKLHVIKNPRVNWNYANYVRQWCAVKSTFSITTLGKNFFFYFINLSNVHEFALKLIYE